MTVPQPKSVSKVCRDREGCKITVREATEVFIWIFVHRTTILPKKTTDIKKYFFSLNPYGPCVSNKEVNGETMTVVWNFYDLKV